MRIALIAWFRGSPSRRAPTRTARAPTWTASAPWGWREAGCRIHPMRRLRGQSAAYQPPPVCPRVPCPRVPC
eukprot:5633775-Prymnesium_polylepis.1